MLGTSSGARWSLGEREVLGPARAGARVSRAGGSRQLRRDVRPAAQAAGASGEGRSAEQGEVLGRAAWGGRASGARCWAEQGKVLGGAGACPGEQRAGDARASGSPGSRERRGRASGQRRGELGRAARAAGRGSLRGGTGQPVVCVEAGPAEGVSERGSRPSATCGTTASPCIFCPARRGGASMARDRPRRFSSPLFPPLPPFTRVSVLVRAAADAHLAGPPLRTVRLRRGRLAPRPRGHHHHRTPRICRRPRVDRGPLYGGSLARRTRPVPLWGPRAGRDFSQRYTPGFQIVRSAYSVAYSGWTTRSVAPSRSRGSSPCARASSRYSCEGPATSSTGRCSVRSPSAASARRRRSSRSRTTSPGPTRWRSASSSFLGRAPERRTRVACVALPRGRASSRRSRCIPSKRLRRFPFGWAPTRSSLAVAVGCSSPSRSRCRAGAALVALELGTHGWFLKWVTLSTREVIETKRLLRAPR